MGPLRVVLLAVALALAAPSPAASQVATQPPQHLLSAVSEGVTVQIAPFTYCRTITNPQGIGTGVCGDGFPAATNPRLPVRRGGSVLVSTGVAVSDLTARYAFADGSPGRELAASPLDSARRLFSIDLANTEPLALLLVSLEYRDVAGPGGVRESGDAHFSVGLAASSKVQPAAVTALPRSICVATRIGSRRCQLRSQGTIRLPAGSGLDCRGGRVRIQVRAGGRRALRATVPTTADCRYRLAPRPFALRRGVRRLRVETRFLGSPTLATRGAPAVRVQLG